MLNRRVTLGLMVGLLFVTFGSPLFSADWNQWRGGERSGVDLSSPELVDALPQRGVKPVWYVIEDDLPAAAASGWSSPVVSGEFVYLFTHKKTQTSQGKLQKRSMLPLVALKDLKNNSQQLQRLDSVVAGPG